MHLCLYVDPVLEKRKKILLPPSISAHQFGTPGLVSAPKLTGWNRGPDSATQA